MWISSFLFIAEFPTVVAAVDPVPYIFFLVVYFLEFWFDDDDFFFEFTSLFLFEQASLFLLENNSLFFSLIFFVTIELTWQFARIFLSDWHVLLFLLKKLFVTLVLFDFISWVMVEKLFIYLTLFDFAKYFIFYLFFFS
jgi:hypothetical protein